MGRQDDLSEEDVEATMLLNSDQMFVIMKALDVYAYALIVSESKKELREVKKIAEIILSKMPKPELNS
jgi:hypothetical protein